MKRFIKFLIQIFYKLFNYSNYLKVKKIPAFLYSNWVSNAFKYFGSDSFINSPIDLKGGKYIIIGDNVTIGKNSILNAWEEYQDEKFHPEIIIGNNVSLGEECHISSINRIVIGNNVLTGRRVSIIDNSHGMSLISDLLIPPAKRKLFTKGPIIIGENVWIADRVSIMPGVKIGKGSIIGANAVVTKDVAPFSVVGGIPASVINKIIEIPKDHQC